MKTARSKTKEGGAGGRQEIKRGGGLEAERTSRQEMQRLF